MSDWNEQAAPNNNIGSTTLKKGMPDNNPHKTRNQKQQKKKHGSL
ncbi:hypothetical protein [Bacillus sp. AK031]